MATTGGQLGSGIKFGYAPTSPHVWVEVTQILEGEPPQFERDRVDVSTHGTTTIRSYIPGLADVSDTRILVLADLSRSSNATHLGLKDLETSQALTWFRFAIPVDPNLATTTYLVYEFQGRVSKWGPSTPIDGPKTIEILVQFGGTQVTLYESLAAWNS